MASEQDRERATQLIRVVDLAGRDAAIASYESEMEDVTATLTPAQVLAVKILRAAEGAYCDWVPCWAWGRYEAEAKAMAAMLKPVFDQLATAEARAERAEAERDAITRLCVHRSPFIEDINEFWSFVGNFGPVPYRALAKSATEAEAIAAVRAAAGLAPAETETTHHTNRSTDVR